MNKSNALSTQPAVKPSLLAPGILQRKCECGNHTLAGGECTACGKQKSVVQRKTAAGATATGNSPPRVMQTKLNIGASDDPLEREADRVADQVMAAPARPAASDAPLRIQRFTGQATGSTDTAPASVDRVLASSGRPMEPALRQDMEQRFGHDFSQVRVHSDGAAQQSAREVNANAYTVGHNVVFGANRFAPETHEGRRLIAHELTHVVQQSSGQVVSGSCIQLEGRPFVPSRALKQNEVAKKEEQEKRCTILADKKRREIRSGTPLTFEEKWEYFWCPDKAGVYCRYGSTLISIGLDLTGLALTATGAGLPAGVSLFLLSTANNVVSAKVCGTFESATASEALGIVGLVASGAKRVSGGAAVLDIVLNLGPIVYEGTLEETSKKSPTASPAAIPSNPAAGKGRVTQLGRPPGR